MGLSISASLSALCPDKELSWQIWTLFPNVIEGLCPLHLATSVCPTSDILSQKFNDLEIRMYTEGISIRKHTMPLKLENKIVQCMI